MYLTNINFAEHLHETVYIIKTFRSNRIKKLSVFYNWKNNFSILFGGTAALYIIDVYLLYYDDLKKSRLYLNTVVLLTVLLCYVRKAEHKVIIASTVLLCCSRMFWNVICRHTTPFAIYLEAR